MLSQAWQDPRARRVIGGSHLRPDPDCHVHLVLLRFLFGIYGFREKSRARIIFMGRILATILGPKLFRTWQPAAQVAVTHRAVLQEGRSEPSPATLPD